MAVLVIAFIVFAAILGALLLSRYGEREIKPASPGEQQAGTFPVTLFFAAADDSGLVREGREIDVCDNPADCVTEVIGELANGPLGELSPTLPAATLVRSVRVDGDLAVVDLGNELVEGLPEGSHAEMLAVYSMVDTIAVNFPRIRRVAFLVDGEPAQTLKGHLDLREPLVPDFTLEKKLAP
jgi:spore germination protein GerM